MSISSAAGWSDAGSITVSRSYAGIGAENRKYATGIVDQPRRASIEDSRLFKIGVSRGFGNAATSGAPLAASRRSEGNGRSQ